MFLLKIIRFLSISSATFLTTEIPVRCLLSLGISHPNTYQGILFPAVTQPSPSLPPMNMANAARMSIITAILLPPARGLHGQDLMPLEHG